MLERFIYENHLGQRFTGLENGVYMDPKNLRDYKWNYDTINGRISRFYDRTIARKITLWFSCQSDEEAIAVKNHLHELTARDIEARLPGKIYIGEYYTNGYITASAKSKYMIDKKLCKIDLTLTSDDPKWYREQTYPFVPGSGDPGARYKKLIAPTPNGLPGIPVSSGGNYTDGNGQQWVCDEIDFARGVYVKNIIECTPIITNANVGTIPIDSKWYDSSKSYSYELYVYSAVDGYWSLCSHFQPYAFANFYNKGVENGFCATTKSCVFNIPKSLGICTTLAEFKEWWSNSGVKLYKVLEAPTETPLDAETLAAYQALLTYSPSTSITNDAGAYMDVGYTTATGEQKTASGTDIVISDSTVAPLNGLTIYGKTTQNGTPTPDAPVELVSLGMGGNIDITLYAEQTATAVASTETNVTVSAFGGGTDYPYDYSYDYALSRKGQKIVCDSVGSNAFRLLIYGEAVNPSVAIGDHIYAINGSVGRGEVLLIDSLNKTITLTTAYGNKINWFDKRGREDYIFEPIPAGQHTVSWVGTFGFDLTVIEKRSEPKWT